MLIDYSNGKIYKIVNDIDSFAYIGSKTLPLNKRMVYHRRDMKRRSGCKIYQHMLKYGTEYFHIILIKNVTCNNREELLREERIELDKINKDISLNLTKPLLTQEEKKEYQKESNKQYMQCEKRKLYNENRKEKRKFEKREYDKHNRIMKELPFYRVPLTISF